MRGLDLWQYGTDLYEVADPAVGNPQSVVPPVGERWYVISLRFEFVTDATVANRQVYFQSSSGLVYGAAYWSNVVQTASLTRTYHCNTGQGSAPFSTLSHIFLSLWEPCVLTRIVWLYISSDNLQAGDQIQNTSVWVFRALDI